MIDPRPLRAWKFIIPPEVISPIGYSGCLAVALGRDEVEAREALHRDAARSHDVDARWLADATVTEIELQPGTVLCWAMQ